MKPLLSALTLALLLSACSTAPSPELGIEAPAAWQSPNDQALRASNQQWWRSFASPELDQLIAQADSGSYDIAAAIARVRQARAARSIAAGTLLPQVTGALEGSREKQMHHNGYSSSSSSSGRETVAYSASFNASYELDFWGGNAAARDSAAQALSASEFDQATVTLTLFSNVASTYLQALALDEQQRIAALNLANARHVLELVQAKRTAGSATALEVAQQQVLVAAQQRRLPLLQQQAKEARITLAALLGKPVQALNLSASDFNRITAPGIAAGLPSDLLSRRPDIAAAEARLAAAQADVRVARAAMLPKVTLSAGLGSGAETAADILRNPFYSLASGLSAPLFNNGRLGAERDRATAVQQELLEKYRGELINAFADVEKALNSIDGLDRQREWQRVELSQAQQAFDIARTRYEAGAELLLNVLDAQRTLYESQDQAVLLHLQRLQASIALYKAVGGGWQVQ
ncbi:efflux transporter outer membrane subunit [Pseudomonas aegrilactucae]|uniref:Efflux transporter outer membrane subunit n=1 Tax=Pseudomonas aegrilactucae TaxID=2854028 RepID=A0A9Q2XP18_9PSED|nr:efflux transporter outer membrane subunit [Pseudomonas aegrilactucae]MBV6289679.1 efflux transporter outer membrane subunit [Pseudomonas aegrilactucae]